MKNVIIWGTGKHYANHKRLIDPDWNIIAFTENGKESIDKTYEGKRIISPSELQNMDFDLLVIASTAKAAILHQAIFDLEIPVEKITLINCYRLLNPDNVEIQVQKDGTTLFCLNGIHFICRTKSDYNVAQDVFDEGDYHLVNSRDQLTVIDVGMNIELASLFFASWPNTKQVYSFEPFQDTYEQAMENFKRNDTILTNKIQTFPYALADKDETKKILYNPAFSEAMSINGKGQDDEAKGVSISIKDAGTVLLPLLEKKQNTKVLLKIDCEGSEYDIFSSMEKKKVLSLLDVILMEWHIPEKNKMLEDLLQKNGFQYVLINGDENRGFLYGFKL